MSSTLPAHGCSSPVTRVAIFKFKSHVSASQKADRAHAFLGLCGAHRDLLVDMPRGGKSLGRSVMLKDPSQETVNIRGSESDFGFIVEFKNVEARHLFDTAEGHEALKNETDPLLESVFVYDFLPEENFGW